MSMDARSMGNRYAVRRSTIALAIASVLMLAQQAALAAERDETAICGP